MHLDLKTEEKMAGIRPGPLEGARVRGPVVEMRERNVLYMSTSHFSPGLYSISNLIS